jgi:hypothetical protein
MGVGKRRSQVSALEGAGSADEIAVHNHPRVEFIFPATGANIIFTTVRRLQLFVLGAVRAPN